MNSSDRKAITIHNPIPCRNGLAPSLSNINPITITAVMLITVYRIPSAPPATPGAGSSQIPAPPPTLAAKTSTASVHRRDTENPVKFQVTFPPSEHALPPPAENYLRHTTLSPL